MVTNICADKLLSYSCSIVPDRVHAKPGLGYIKVCDPREKFLIPPVYLHKPLLVISQCKPLITPIARTDGIRMTSTGRCRVETDLALNMANLIELEGGDVAGQCLGVGSGCGKEVFAAVRRKDDVGPVHVRIGDAGRDEGKRSVAEHRGVRLLVDDIFCKSVAGFHKSIKVLAGRVNCYPPWVIIGRRGHYITDHLEFASDVILSVRPDAVGPHVGGIEIGLGWIKDHAVDGALVAVLVVLYIGLKGPGAVNGEDVAEASMFVERVAIDVIGWKLGGEKEDSPGPCAFITGLGWTLVRSRSSLT